ncbi:unnamed protein product [Absidia cylindrospora]
MTDVLPPTSTEPPQTPSPPASLTTVKHASRFTEHFDIVLPPAAFDLFILGNETGQPQQQQRSMSISASRPSVFAKPVRMHSSPAITTSSSSSMDDKQPVATPDSIHAFTTNGNEDTNNSSQLNTPSVLPPTSNSTPFQGPVPSKQQQQQQQQQQSIALLYKDYAASSTNSLNRADMMIKRLSNWLVFLKLATGWLVEIQKMMASSAFKRLKKDHPERYDQINKKRKECQGIISNFKKECRDKIHALKINPALQMEELLLRANETRKRMAHLSKLCDQADDSKRPHLPELDPWLANLQVLRYLKRETTEENRLRELMVPIQQDMKELETKLIDAFTGLVDFCVEQETTVTKYGTTLDQVLGHFLPQHTWQAFVAAQQKEWVDEDHIKKNYVQINYPNKQHTHVATVRKGVLGRRSGVLKHYHDKYFVLTHYGYLHQFKLEDKIKPEASIYVTSTTIQPEVNDDDLLFDEQHMAEEMDTNNNSAAGGHTFDIRLHKSKTYHFKTTTGSELVSWCRALTNVANGSSVEKLLALRKQKLVNASRKTQQHNHQNGTSSSSITSSFTTHIQQQHLSSHSHHHVNNNDDDDDDDDAMSQFHSIHSNNDNDQHPPLAESDIMSLAIGHDDETGSSSLLAKTIPSSPSSSSLCSSSFDQQQAPTPTITTAVAIATKSTPAPFEDESGIYFSSTSSPSSSSSTSAAAAAAAVIAPPKRAVPTYQANLNLMVASTITPPSSS